MVKHIYGWEMNKKLNNKHKVFVRSFSGTKKTCMRNHIKPCIRENSPEHVVLHVGTNDLPSVKPVDSISGSITTLAQEVIPEKRSVSISSIIPRNDKWDNKVFEVNSCFQKLCDDAKIDYIDSSINKNRQRHLSNSNLNLNTKGSGKLLQNFVTFIKKTFSTSNDVTRSQPKSGQSSFRLSSSKGNNNLRNNSLSYNLNRSNDHVDVDSNSYFGDQLSSLRKKNLNRLILAHLNINSIRNKLDQLVNGIKGNIDVLMISESKLDNSFPFMQFLIKGYGPPYRLDCNSHGGFILVYVCEVIPCKLIPMKNCTIEGSFIELNLRSKKWLISCSYNPHRTFHLNSIGKNVDLLSRNYENIFLMGDFNTDMEKINLKNFFKTLKIFYFKNVFMNICKATLDKVAPLKQKHVRSKP